MSVFGIFKTSKQEGSVPEFVGQVSDPNLQIISEVSGKVTGGEQCEVVTRHNGVFVAATTENNYIDFVEKSECLDLIRRSKK